MSSDATGEPVCGVSNHGDVPHGDRGPCPLCDRPRCVGRAKNRGDGTTRCRKPPVTGATVCRSHGAGAPQVKTKAADRDRDRRAESKLREVWNPDAAPVTDPVAAMQALAGKLNHAVDVLGERLDDTDPDDTATTAWIRVTRELRQLLEAMERLGLATRQIELEEAQVVQVLAAVKTALEAADLDGVQQDLFVRTFLAALGRALPADPTDQPADPAESGEPGELEHP